MIGGINGVGKSSFAGVLKEHCEDLGQIINVDKMVTELENDAVLGRKTAITKIEDCINRGLSFTQETTLSGYRTAMTANKVKYLGYFVRLFYIGLDSVDESLLRIQNRVKRGGHNIPTDDVERRFQGRWEAVAKVLPYCDIAEFYDNDNGFVKVAEYRNGEFFKVGNYSSKWLSELIDFLSV